MSCACKVNTHIKNIHKNYGIKNTVKTNIKEKVHFALYKLFIGLICIPILPLILIYLIIRKLITNKPMSIKIFLKQNKNVRN